MKNSLGVRSTYKQKVGRMEPSELKKARLPGIVRIWIPIVVHPLWEDDICHARVIWIESNDVNSDEILEMST